MISRVIKVEERGWASADNPHPSYLLLFLLSPTCRVEMESDATKLISGNSGSDAEVIDIGN